VYAVPTVRYNDGVLLHLWGYALGEKEKEKEKRKKRKK
jgi:hypothetical protein